MDVVANPARELAAKLRMNWNVDYDTSGAIGRVGQLFLLGQRQNRNLNRSWLPSFA